MKKYEKIINDIILKIQTGIFKEGEQLYTEKEIKEIYNVSSTTAVRVLNELESAGYIFRIQGKGSFVNKTLVNKKVFVTENNNFHIFFRFFLVNIYTIFFSNHSSKFFETVHIIDINIR